jgi:putative inorganic carbon (hco3(-)) transporter
LEQLPKSSHSGSRARFGEWAKSRLCVTENVRLIQLLGILMCLPALVFPHQLPFELSVMSLAGLVLLALLGYVLTRRPVVPTPVDLPIWILLLLSPVSLLVTVDPSSSLPQVFKLIAGGALFYGIEGFASERPRVLRIIPWGICVLGAILAVIVLIGTQWGSELPGFLRTITTITTGRFRPFWKEEGYAGFNTNIAAGTLAMFLPVVVSYAVFPSGFKRRVSVLSVVLSGIAMSTAVLLCLLLLLTESWGALLGIACAAAAVLASRGWRWSVVVGMISLGLLIMLTTYASPERSGFVNAVMADVSFSADSRLELWSRAIYMMQDFPFTGIGMGSVRVVLPLLYPTFRLSPTIPMDHLHSVYLNTGAEMGLLGLIALCAFLLGLLNFSLDALRNGNCDSLAPSVAGLFGTLIVFCVHGLTDAVTTSTWAHLVAWGLFGVGVAVNRHSLQACLQTEIPILGGRY